MKNFAKYFAWNRSVQMKSISWISKVCMLTCLTATLPIAANASTVESNTSIQQNQEKTITGQVIDKNGQALIGVNIIVKGTTNGTTTDFDGNYTINATLGSTLMFTYIGFLNQEVVVENLSSINITLLEDVQGLDEVVVVGYGVQKKSDLTGAVASVKSEEMEKVAVSNPAEALQGRVAGVSVTKTGGAPGAGVDIKIRGVGTIGNNQPLYIIDGIPGSMYYLNPGDIASIEVLKDGAAAAIYGSRAANGVVIITTKKGKKGSVRVDFDAYSALVQSTDEYELLDAAGYQKVHKMMYENAGKELPQYVTAPIKYNTNWIDEVFQTALTQNYNLRISGANDVAHYSLSGNFMDEEGTVIGSGFTKNSLRAKTGITKGRLTLNSNISYTETESDYYKLSLRESYDISPLIPVLDANEKYGYGLTYFDTPHNTNPIAIDNFVESNNKTEYFVANMNVDFKITDWLQWRSNFGLRNSNETDFYYYPDYIANKKTINQYPFVEEKRTNWREEIQEHMLTFNKDFGKHSVNAVAAVTKTSQKSKWIGANVEGKTVERAVEDGNIIETIVPGGFLDNGFKTLDGGKGGTYSAWGSNYKYNRSSVLGRINYAFDNRYLFQATFRRDGSSKFGKDSRWGNFPSASFGWRISEEDFMEQFDFVDNLKFRASWGKLGNEVTLGYYDHQALIETSNTYYGGYSRGNGQNPWPGSIARDLENRELKWEKTESINIGLDYGILNNKFFGSVNYYRNTTSDMLVEFKVPISAGVNDPIVNVGEVQNSGLEFELTYANNDNEFQYNITGTFSTLNNEVKALANNDQVLYGDGLKYGSSHYPNQTRVGHEVGAFFLYQADGIFQSMDEVNAHKNVDGELIQPDAHPGDIRFKDVDGNGELNEDDMIYSGSGIPDFEYSMNFSANYKNFDFTLFMQGVGGKEIYNGNRFELEGMDAGRNFLASTLNAWTPDNRNTSMPRAVLGDPNRNNRESTRFLEDGDYLRIKTVQLGYTLPENLIQKLNIAKLRFYVSGQNLFTFTNYSGLDPEVAGIIDNATNRVNPLSTGVDRTIYPITKSYIFGLQLSF